MVNPVDRPMCDAQEAVLGLNPILGALAVHSSRVRKTCLEILALATTFGTTDAASDYLQQAERFSCLAWPSQCARLNVGAAFVRSK